MSKLEIEQMDALNIPMTEKIEFISIDDLSEWDNNPRNNDHAVESIIKSMKQFGFTIPLLINDENKIIAGNTRFKAAKILHLQKLPCMRASHLPPALQAAYNIADNKLNEIATWNQEILKRTFEQLVVAFEENQQVFDPSITGYSQAEYDTLANGWESNIAGMKELKEDSNPAMCKVVVECNHEDEVQVKRIIEEVLSHSMLEYKVKQ